jgi:hypothetical protein
MAVYVVGWEQFYAAGARLRSAEVERELRQAARDAIGPVSGRVRRSAVERLPRRGELGTFVARTTDFAVVTTGEGARLTATSSHDIDALDHGRDMHPLFGDKRHWYVESVRPGWWSDPLNASEPGVRAQFEQAMENVKQRIEGG